MIYFANLQMQMTCSDQPFFFGAKILHKCERERERERERISLLQDSAAIFKEKNCCI
jgi:hypothetical protein